MSDEEDEDKQTVTDLIAPPPSHTLGPSQSQPVPGHFSLLKRQSQHSEATTTPDTATVKISAAATKSIKNNGESSTSNDKTDSSSRAGAGKGSRSHAKQDRHHPSKRSQMAQMNCVLYILSSL